MMKSYRCVICGYIHIGENPPEKCPICGASSSEFEIVEENNSNEVEQNSWRCLNCEYIHEESDLPDKCPICGVGSDMFEGYVNEQNLANDIEDINVVIIGSGISGISCAEEIRKNNDKAIITIISEDTEVPYYRLNLTRYLAGEISKEELYMQSSNWYEDREINLLLEKSVVGIKRAVKSVVLDDHTTLKYDKLVIANGAHPFIPPFKGGKLRNVLSVRNIQDVDYILEKIKTIKSCVCIGGGILGLEVAGAISKHGVKVTLLEGSDWLMPRQLNQKAASHLKGFLNNIGIKVIENAKTEEILGVEECTGVKLTTGETIESKLVIITTGVRANKHLAIKADLEVNHGVVVDNYMNTSDSDIYAIGDVSEHHGISYGLWNTAQFQGVIAAQNINGMNVQFGGIPRSNVLKVLGLDLFSVGEFIPSDGSYYTYEDERQDKYILVVLRDGKIVGSIVIGDKALSIKVKTAIEKGSPFPCESFKGIEPILEKLMEE
jgi:nitrite reductase (NADH) large subunit